MPRFRFFPLFVLATLKTIGMGISSTAVSSMLIIELGQPAWIAGVVGAVYNLGFVVFILFLGNLADRMPRYKALRLLLVVSVVAAAVRLIPLTTPSNIAIFSVFNFLEGGVCGLFWCVMQSYTLVAHRIGEKERDNYLSGYNFSWNIGVIGGFVLGTVFVPLAGTNYISFWINFINAAIMGVLAFASVKDERPIVLNKSDVVFQDTRIVSIPEEPAVARALKLYAPYLVLLILLVHSFADGSITVMGPVKIKTLLLSSEAVYVIMLVKYSTQTIACSLGPRIPLTRLPRILQIMPLGIALAWIYFGFAGDIWGSLFALALSGVAQGFLYAAGLKYLAHKAQQGGVQNKMFAWFQITMGSGRGLGPFIMGMVAEVSFPLGIGTQVVFGILMTGIALAIPRFQRNALK